MQAFLEQAAADPNVLAIKQTLYRTSIDSPIVDALIDAAEAGKQVVVLVEIKARFDERANIKLGAQAGGGRLPRRLRPGRPEDALQAGAGRPPGEGRLLRRYCHIGTGNYHPKTARLYEDLGLLTADPTVGADVTDLFNVLTGYSPKHRYRRLLVAPTRPAHGPVERIEREVDRHRDGRPARIRFKFNSIVDEAIIDALYRASQAGVPVDLLVRGICSLRPGVPGLSENIRVRSILGRFLEHSRIFAFGVGGTSE